MADEVRSAAQPLPRLSRFRALGPAALAAGGVAAAFGAASCCAIPVLLGGIGLGGLGSAVFMPILLPYQPYLIGAAAVCLLAGGIFWRRDACACRVPRTATTLMLIALGLGATLLALGLSYG